LKHRIEYLFLRILAGFLQLLPLRCVRALAGTAGCVAYHLVPVRKKLASAQLTEAFPEKPAAEIRAIVRETYTSIATTIFELLYSPRLTRKVCERTVRFHNLDVVLNAQKTGRGVVLVSGHIGNWEWPIVAMMIMHGIDTLSVYHPPSNPYVDTLLSKYRTLNGNKVVTMADAPRRLLRVLQQGGVIVLVADQSAPRESVFINLMNKPAATFKGPATFALRTGAEVVSCYGIRDSGGDINIYFQLIDKNGIGDDPETAVNELTRRCVKDLETYIRKYPGQWLWEHRRWKNVPESPDDIFPDPAD
jgi:KDO2-lipid IV(A) lauroyltransferase